MTLKAEIKERITAAMKAGRSLEKEILRVAYGEIQTLEARSGKAPSDQESEKVVRKLIKSNRETLAASPSTEQAEVLNQEIAILEELLPKSLSQEELKELLAAVAAEVKSAPSQGAAMGVAMKHLKGNASGDIDASKVAQIVAQLRK